MFSFGHVAFQCPERSPKLKHSTQGSSTPQKSASGRDKQIDVVEMRLSQQRMQKSVKISDLQIDSLVDTGSSLTLLRRTFTDSSGPPPFTSVPIQFSDISNSNIQHIRSFFTGIEIDDNNVFSTTAYVIKFSQMSVQLMFGTDVIFQSVLTCDKTGATLSKSPAPDIFIHYINVQDDVPEVKLTHIRDTTCGNEVADIIENYRPTRAKSIDLKMWIVLTDNLPVYQRPPRMSMTEKEILNNQLNQWLRDGIIQPSCSENANPVVLVKKKDN